jgi:tellurite resistance protein TehA-like permease
LIGLGASLYLVPYLLGVQVTTVNSSISNQLASILVSSHNQTIALALCYLSGFVAGIMGLVAVAYNLRLASPPPRKTEAGAATQPATPATQS